MLHRDLTFLGQQIILRSQIILCGALILTTLTSRSAGDDVFVEDPLDARSVIEKDSSPPKTSGSMESTTSDSATHLHGSDQNLDAFSELVTHSLTGPFEATAGIVILAILLILTIWVLWFLQNVLRAIPPTYRQMDPAMVWLMLIPCHNLIWSFVVLLAVSNSLRSFLHHRGEDSVGDCGAGLGIAIGICLILMSIPCLNYITSPFCLPAFLILTTVYLLKIAKLKRRLAPYLNLPPVILGRQS